MSLHWKMHTNFPFSRVFVLGIILFFLGLASMIIAIIAFVTESWGSYVGTGIWGGATILTSGLTAVYVSRLRSLASVKAFCICSVFAMFTSLTMLILSAGGLTLSSGFYSRIDLADYNKRTSNLIHASLLVISVFCLSGSVLAVIVCCKYLFFEHYDKPKRRRHHRNLSDGAVRTNTLLRGGAPNTTCQRSGNSQTRLYASEQTSRRHSDNVDVNRVQIEYRRSHKRSASDQPHSNSHARRQKHNHLETNHGSGNTLLPHDARHHPDRRNGTGRNSAHQRGDSRERERLNIVGARQTSSRPVSQTHTQAGSSKSPASASPKIRLPTEFNEEELPPYEPVEPPVNAATRSHSDSGDESDTENSSSTDAVSFIAGDEEGAESVQMIEMQQSQGRTSQPHEENSQKLQTTNFMSCLHGSEANTNGRTLERRAHPMMSCRDHSELGTLGAGAMIVRKDSNRSSRPVLSYINAHSQDLGDYEHLLSVSPEVCAITGESPEPVPGPEHRVPRTVTEHFYENGPCYENIHCGGRSLDEESMNHLSKFSPSNLTAREKDAHNKLKATTKEVCVRVLTHTSPVSNASQQSPGGSFGSPQSAFRPVAAAPAVLPSHNMCSSASNSPSSLHSNNGASSPQNDVGQTCCRGQNLSTHNCIHAYRSKERQNSASDLPASSYIEQGAIPKVVKHREGNFCDTNSTAASWKNIPLPSSYNHSKSASNESEKKLPSKNIPFADSDVQISRTFLRKDGVPQTEQSSSLSPHLYPSKEFVSSSITCPPTTSAVSSFGAAAEAFTAASTRQNSRGIPQADHLQTSGNAAVSRAVELSVREASTQVSSGSTSRRLSHRMGGNQSLLQSRREELQNCQLSCRTAEVLSRSVRPSCLPVTAGFGSGAGQGVSGLMVDRHSRNQPSDVSSYVGSHPGQGQQVQPITLRQNHLMQHYPLQPQQPRLGVQLHQRRQQQHQLQQNIESQHQHQQQQQLNQQPQLGNQQPQLGNQQNGQQGHQGRSVRPLFSVLL